MKIIKCEDRSPSLAASLLNVWTRSVSATHTFLTESDIERIAEYVPAAIDGIPVLIVAEEQGAYVGFAGVEDKKLEMLFIDPDFRNQGIGKQMMQYLLEHHGISEVSVNEQNPKAVGFYRKMGFRTYKRTELDEQGNPFPLLYMKY